VAKQTADQSGDGPEVIRPASKPPSRPTKGRPSAAQREKRIADAAAAAAMQAMTSIAPTPSQASVHFSVEPTEHPPEGEQDSTEALTQIQRTPYESKFPSLGLSPTLGEGVLNPRYTFKSFIVGKS